MPDDDFQIEVGEAVRRHILRKSSPLSDSSKAVVAYDSPDTDPIPVFIADQVLQSMERQAAADKEREIGGVLLGGFYRNDEGSFVDITDYVEATSAKGTDVSLTFTHETWEAIHARIGQKHDDNLQIVGWYHSHPGLGVFMSKDDEFIHASYFSDPWHVAIVHDPIYTNWGCFKWTDGELERAGGFYIYAEKRHGKQLRDYVKGQLASRQAPPRSASHSADRLIRPSFVKSPSIWTAVIVMLLLQVALGWFVLSKRGGGGRAVDEYKIAVGMLQRSNLSGGQEHLRLELSAHPANARAYRDLLTLNKALASPGVAASNRQDYDRTNMVLAAGDELVARQDVKHTSTSVSLKMNEGGFRWEKGMPTNAELVADNPTKMVVDAYSQAAGTRSARISRAKAVSAIAKTWWARDAVKWLEEEELRLIAYGKQSAPLEYQDQYKKLPKARQAIVDSVLRKKK